MESRKILKEEYLEIFNSFPLRGIIDVCNLNIEGILRSKVSINNLLDINRDYRFLCLNVICELLNKRNLIFEGFIDYEILCNDPYLYLIRLLSIVSNQINREKLRYLSGIVNIKISNYNEREIIDIIKSLGNSSLFCCDTMRKVPKSSLEIWRYGDEGLKIVSTSLYIFNNIVNIYTGFDNIENFRVTDLHNKDSELYRCILNDKYFDLDKVKTTTKTAWDRKPFKDERLRVATQSEYRFYFIVNLYSDFSLQSTTQSTIQSEPISHLSIQLTNSSSSSNSSGGKRRKTIPKKIRDDVWERDCGRNYDGICFCCRESVSCKGWECGHIVSDADGGLPTLDNLKVLCQPCNRSMGRENLYEYKNRHYPI